MKKLLIPIICVTLLCLSAMPIAAGNNTQIYNLSALSDNTLVLNTENAVAFWEKPTLKAGEYTTTTGTLIVRNSTATKQNIKLRTVELPYDNEEALRYLNHVHITVSDGSTTLYEGAYSRINDDHDFTISATLSANTEKVYAIDLRCDYTYVGEGLSTNDLIEWEFYTVTEPTEKADFSTFSDSVLLEMLIACGIAAVLLGSVYLYERLVKKRK